MSESPLPVLLRVEHFDDFVGFVPSAVFAVLERVFQLSVDRFVDVQKQLVVLFEAFELDINAAVQAAQVLPAHAGVIP